MKVIILVSGFILLKEGYLKPHCIILSFNRLSYWLMTFYWIIENHTIFYKVHMGQFSRDKNIS